MKRILLIIFSITILLSLSSNSVQAKDVKNTYVHDYFSFASGEKHDFTAEFYYKDAYFIKPASEYNDSLATASLCFAMSAFASNETDDYDLKAQNAVDFLKKTGFRDIQANEDFHTMPMEDSMGVIIGHKEIYSEGKKYTLIAVTTRGGGYEAEWAGNFKVGETGRHEGFEMAASKVRDFLKEYLETHKGEINYPIKLWMTGYSRGGAAINLAAADITLAQGIDEVEILPQNIYAYCFENPMDENTDHELSEGAITITNIFNIINPYDLVPKVPMESWGFIRYGVTENVIPLTRTPENEEEYKKMFHIFQKLNTEYTRKSLKVVTDENGKKKVIHALDTFQAKKFDADFKFDWSVDPKFEETDTFLGKIYLFHLNPSVDMGVAFVQDDDLSMPEYLDRLMWNLSVNVGGRVAYLENQQDGISLVAAFLGSKDDNKISWGEMKNVPEAMRIVTGDLGSVVLLTIMNGNSDDLLTLIYNIDILTTAHYPELCLAWLQMRDPNYIFIEPEIMGSLEYTIIDGAD